MSELLKIKDALRIRLLATGVAIVCVEFDKPKTGIMTVQGVSCIDASGDDMTILSNELNNEMWVFFSLLAKPHAHKCDGGSLVWNLDLDADTVRFDIFTKSYAEISGWDAVRGVTKESANEADSLVQPSLSGKNQNETSIPVKHWGAYDVDGTVDTHQLDIADARAASGLAFITVRSLDGNLDDMLSVTMEVNTNPLNGIDHVPCAHIHFDNDALAVSLYKIGDQILVRTENGIEIKAFSEKVGGFPETFYWVK